MKRLTLALMIVAALPSFASASTEDLDKKVMRATKFATEPMPMTNRKALAEAALAYWKSFDSRIPRNSPAVADWLKTELSTTDTVRIGKAAATPEYALMMLAETSSDCVNFFSLLNAEIEESSLRELYLWTKALACYSNPHGLLEYLQQAGLSNGRFDGEFHMQHFLFFHNAVTGYIANAIESERRP